MSPPLVVALIAAVPASAAVVVAVWSALRNRKTGNDLEGLKAAFIKEQEILKARLVADQERLKALLGTDQELRKLAAKASMDEIVKLMAEAMVIERRAFHGTARPGARWLPPKVEELNDFQDHVRTVQWLLPEDLSRAFGTYLAKLEGVGYAKDAGPEMMKIWNAAQNAYDDLTKLARSFIWPQHPPNI